MESGPSMHLGEDEQDNELIILRLDIYYKRHRDSRWRYYIVCLARSI